jgi:hypothetical protein
MIREPTSIRKKRAAEGAEVHRGRKNRNVRDEEPELKIVMFMAGYLKDSLFLAPSVTSVPSVVKIVF